MFYLYKFLCVCVTYVIFCIIDLCTKYKFVQHYVFCSSFVEKHVAEYTKNQLRPPPQELILKWAGKWGISKHAAEKLSQSLPLRHQLGIFVSGSLM